MPIGDISKLAKELVALLREHEVEKAIERADAAKQMHFHTDFIKRQAAIEEINKGLKEVKTAQKQILDELRLLPESERFDAEHRLIPIIDMYFNAEISKLRAFKRKRSLPE